MKKANASAKQFSTKRISVFLNGIVFFQKSGTLDASSNQVKFNEFPVGNFTGKDQVKEYDHYGKDTSVLFGSVRFSSTTNPLLQMTVFDEAVQIPVAITSLTAMLSNNLDKNIHFTLKGDSTSYSGKAISLINGFLLVKMEKGWKQVELGAIDFLDFDEAPNLSQDKAVRKKVLQLDFERKEKSVPVNLTYFQKGIAWLPNYHLQLLGDNKAKLSLKASILNEIEDLQDVTVDFVMGIPSFSTVKEPLFSNQSLEGFMGDIEHPPKFRTSYGSRSIVEAERGGRNVGHSYNTHEEGVGIAGDLSGEDQFAYTRAKLNVPKGSRMLIHLLDTEITYEDIYSVQLKKSFSRGSGNNIVWHSIKFKNNSGLPLPTGTIAFIKQEEDIISPISQNKLDFVPAGLFGGVRMTQVPDITVFDTEKSIQVEEKAGQKAKLYTVEAILSISNFKRRAVTLEVNQKIEGELLSSSDPWTIKALGIQQKLPQKQSHEVRWKIPLQAGEQKKLIYSFKFLLDQ